MIVHIDIPYGKSKQILSLDESNLRGVLRAGTPESQQKQEDIIAYALANPIGSAPLSVLSANVQRVLIITSDHTRPVPSAITLPPMLKELRKGNPDIQVKILVATGVHRSTTQQELYDKFTKPLVDQEEFIVHNAFDENMLELGTLDSGCELTVNPLVAWADLIISDGFIEPHFFAGFSGGRKSILPGIASAKSIMSNHCAKLIASTLSRTGILEGNPIHRDMTTAASRAGLKFILNVILDDNKKVVAAFAGDTIAAHKAGCEYSRALFCVDPVESAIVITSNGGAPLDQNIYQSVKSMTAAESCVHPNGYIICLAQCADGSGGEQFVRWFAETQSPQALLDKVAVIAPEDTIADQWQAQILARVMCKANVILVCDKKNRDMVTRMGMLWFDDVNQALAYAKAQLKEQFDGVTVIPNGVSVIPVSRR